MMQHTVKIPLPYTKPPMSANSRFAHWAVRAKQVRNIRQTAAVLALHHRLPKTASHMVVQLTYTPRDKRRRDPSNLMPTQKALIDGLVQDYGLLPDDCQEYVTERMPRIMKPSSEPTKSRLSLELTFIWKGQD